MAVRKSRLRRFLNSDDEALYIYFANNHTYNGKCVGEIERTKLSIEQFVLYCADDIEPENPEEYYLVLKNGRKWFFWQQEELRQLYLTKEWFGWYSLIEDWKDNLWVLKRLTTWYKGAKPCV